MPFVECFACWSREMFWWTVPDDKIRRYSLHTSSGNDKQLLALMWLDLHMDISLGLPAITLAKLNPNILDNTYILNLLPLTLRLIIVAERTMFSSGGYWRYMHYAWGISINCYVYQLLCYQLLYSLQFCDGHDTQQPCAAFTLVGISRQMLTNSAIYVGHDITLLLRRTWLLFSDSSHSLDVTTVLRFVTLARLDYYSQTRHIRRTLLLLTDLFCRTWTISHLWSSWSGL